MPRSRRQPGENAQPFFEILATVPDSLASRRNGGAALSEKRCFCVAVVWGDASRVRLGACNAEPVFITCGRDGDRPAAACGGARHPHAGIGALKHFSANPSHAAIHDPKAACGAERKVEDAAANPRSAVGDAN